MALWDEHPELLQDLAAPQVVTDPAEQQQIDKLLKLKQLYQSAGNDNQRLDQMMSELKARPDYQSDQSNSQDVVPQQSILDEHPELQQHLMPITEMNEGFDPHPIPQEQRAPVPNPIEALGILAGANDRSAERQIGFAKQVFGSDPATLKAYYDQIHQKEAADIQAHPGYVNSLLRTIGGGTLPAVEATGAAIAAPFTASTLGQTGVGALEMASLADPGKRIPAAVAGGVLAGGASMLGNMIFTNTPAQAMQAYKAGGTLAQVSGGRKIRGVENSLASTSDIAGGLEEPYVNQSENLVDRLNKAIPEVDTRQIYTNGPKELQAQNAKLAAENQSGYDAAYNYADQGGHKVPMTNTLATLDKLENGINQSSAGLESSTKAEALDRIQKLKDSLLKNNSTLSPATIRANTEAAGKLSYEGTGDLKYFGSQVKNSLRNDFKDYAIQSGDPELYNKFTQADKFYHDVYSPWKNDKAIQNVLEGGNNPSKNLNALISGKPSDYLDQLGFSPETRAAINSKAAMPIREAAIGLKGEAAPMKAAKAARRVAKQGTLDPTTQAEVDNIVSDIRVLKAKNVATPKAEGAKGLYEKASNIATYLPKLAYSTIAKPGSVGPFAAAHLMQQPELVGAGLKNILYGLQMRAMSASPKKKDK